MDFLVLLDKEAIKTLSYSPLNFNPFKSG